MWVSQLRVRINVRKVQSTLKCGEDELRKIIVTRVYMLFEVSVVHIKGVV